MMSIIASTYELIEEIGSGGGGRVFLAYHKRLNKKVILKADKRTLSTPEELLRREADVLKNLSNSFIPQVYDYFVEDGVVYTVMEYIEGESLDKPLDRGERFPQATVIKWAIQLLHALSYLHEPVHGNPPRGYVHSDIKPANIMKRANGDISLIDFNIALALGEEHAVGGSPGYASPEHYSRDRKPDIRSDIYSVGATLYHLLSGERPSPSAFYIVPLSTRSFNPALVKIIMKAMDPNPDLRYQSAAEMLYALKHIRENDSRYRRLKRQILTTRVILLLLMAAGVTAGFIGLRRMQVRSAWLNLTNSAKGQYEQGDTKRALTTIMKAYPKMRFPFDPDSLSQSQVVLTEILGVYDQKDTFEPLSTFQLPSAPLSMKISPDGRTALCTYDENLAVIDLKSADIVATLPMVKSAVADAKYLNEDIVIYAGEYGITAYSIVEKKNLWKGELATAISISADGSRIAAVYKDAGYALLYQADTGEQVYKADFHGKYQKTGINDIFKNTYDNLFALNSNGSRLAVSFSDGSLSVLNLEAGEGNRDIEIFSNSSGFDHYEGGFYQNYLAVAGSNENAKESVFIISDVNTVTQTGGFKSEGYYTTKADEDGIVVGVDNVLVRIDPKTGNQTPLIDTASTVNVYGYDERFTAIADAGKTLVFDRQTNLIGEISRDVQTDFLAVGKEYLLIGSSDSPIVWIAKYVEHPDTALAEYDMSCLHDEARLSGDEKTIMYFSFDSFMICNLEGDVIKTVAIPDAYEVYDQQFRREASRSFLEVFYYDGRVHRYDASTGEMFEEIQGKEPDKNLEDIFETSELRIVSPLHGTPKVYDRETGEMVCELEEDAYLTYVTEIENYIVVQYVTTDSQFYGYLMNQQCEKLAYLPGICDVLSDGFLFDYHIGYIRKTPLYDLTTLVKLANRKLVEE